MMKSANDKKNIAPTCGGAKTDVNCESPVVVAIHQPDFFPWLGFFDKLVNSDKFIILDHAQFPKTGGTYCNRVQLLAGGEGHWVTAPVARNYTGVRSIAESEFKIGDPWREKFIKTIRTNYGKAPCFSEGIEIFEPLIRNQEQNISRFNSETIIALAKLLDIPITRFHFSSCLAHKGTSTEMLISLTQAVGGHVYIAGSGAAAYQDDSLFETANITLIKRHYKHPVYQQVGSSFFTPGLSIIDAFMNCGLVGVSTMLQSVNLNSHGINLPCDA